MLLVHCFHLGAIRPDLYTRKGSMFMQGVNRDPVIGRMHLQLRYDFKRSDLVVAVLKGINKLIMKVRHTLLMCFFVVHESA